MAITPKRHGEIQALIVQGMDVSDISRKTNVGRATVYNIKNGMIADAKENDINTLGRANPAILAEVASTIRARAPLALEEEVTKLLGAAESLQRLEVNFHKSFDLVLSSANNLLKREDLSIVDWQIVTNTLAGAFKDIYNSKGTTINVAQADHITGNNTNSLTMFQSRMKS